MREMICLNRGDGTQGRGGKNRGGDGICRCLPLRALIRPTLQVSTA